MSKQEIISTMWLSSNYHPFVTIYLSKLCSWLDGWYKWGSSHKIVKFVCLVSILCQSNHNNKKNSVQFLMLQTNYLKWWYWSTWLTTKSRTVTTQKKPKKEKKYCFTASAASVNKNFFTEWKISALNASLIGRKLAPSCFLLAIAC